MQCSVTLERLVYWDENENISVDSKIIQFNNYDVL